MLTLGRLLHFLARKLAICTILQDSQVYGLEINNQVLAGFSQNNNAHQIAFNLVISAASQVPGAHNNPLFILNLAFDSFFNGLAAIRAAVEENVAFSSAVDNPNQPQYQVPSVDQLWPPAIFPVAYAAALLADDGNSQTDDRVSIQNIFNEYAETTSTEETMQMVNASEVLATVERLTEVLVGQFRASITSQFTAMLQNYNNNSGESGSGLPFS